MNLTGEQVELLQSVVDGKRVTAKVREQLEEVAALLGVEIKKTCPRCWRDFAIKTLVDYRREQRVADLQQQRRVLAADVVFNGRTYHAGMECSDLLRKGLPWYLTKRKEHEGDGSDIVE